MKKDEVSNVTPEDVEKTAEEFGRIALDLPEHDMIIVMDDTLLGHIKQFDHNPEGLTKARRWAVRMQESDETSEQSFEDLRSEYLEYIGQEQPESEH